jgi:hypothetical protein
MSMTISSATARLAREVPEAEARIDEALISLSGLMSTMVQARRDTDTPASTGQAALLRLAKAQMALLDAGSDVLRVHSELLKVGRTTAGLDLEENCDKFAALETAPTATRTAA